MVSWTPQEEGLKELVSYLKQTTEGNSETQSRVRQSLDQFNAVPDYNNYLCYILITPLDDLSTEHRSISGYLLVKHLRERSQSIDPSVYEYLKKNLWASLLDKAPEIRRSGSNALSRLIQAVGPEAWPESLSRLVELMDSAEDGVRESAFFTIAQICEDITGRLDTMVIQGQRPLDYIVPKLIEGVASSNPKVRSQSLSALLPFVSRLSSDPPDQRPSALRENIDQFITNIFKNATDPSLDVRRKVCQTIVQLLAHLADVLLPNLNEVVDYMLVCTKHEDQELATDACEFWLTFSESPDLEDALRSMAPKVAPVLLECMVYSEIELASLGAYEEDDAEKPDRQQDIKPRFHSGKSHKLEASVTEPGDSSKKESSHRAVTDQKTDAELSQQENNEGPVVEEEEEDDDDYDSQLDDMTDWTLRKCSAAALDAMAISFEDELLKILLPHLEERLWSENWMQRESGILALGALAEGCINALEGHLPVLFPFLLQNLDHPQPLVRSITCWTLGRYSRWCASPESSPDIRQQYFLPLIEGILRKVLDNNKRVQEAGCSAFAALEEEAGQLLVPYLEPILRNLVYAFSKYQKKNLLILYDAIGTLAENVGDALNREDYLNILMPPLTERWDKVADDEDTLVPLMECLASIITAAAPALSGLLSPMFQRCVRIIHASLYAQERYNSDPQNIDPPEPIVPVVALDMLSSITTSIGETATSLYTNSNPPAIPLLQYSLDHPEPPVRQSGLALLGDIVINCFSVLEPVVTSFMPHVLKNLETEPHPERVGVCNNAVWSSEEKMEPYAEELMRRLVPILVGPKSAKSLIENSAVTIGRLGCACPGQVSTQLEPFAAAWCNVMAEMKDNAEKESAFKGMCLVIQANPQAITKNFHFFLNAVARTHVQSPELFEMLRNMFAGYKMLGEEQWRSMVQMLPEGVAQGLGRYGV